MPNRILPPIVLLLALGLLGSSEPRAAAEPAYAPDGLAFLKKHCLACHSGEKAKADLRLDTFPDEASLLKDRKTWTRVLDVLKAGEMPPDSKPKPAVAELDGFTKLVQSAFEKHDKSAKPDPGRVTMRRLNRNEYNHTIRDLVGIDFNPAEDFPSDDVGYGFDNNGDVLTLPPVLLERYLAAAETIMAQAITPIPPKPPVRGVGTQFTEPAGPNVPMKNHHRVVSFNPKGTPVETGPIFTRFNNLPREGEYRAQTTVYIETTGTKPVKVAILAGCAADAKGQATDAEADAIAGAAVKALRPFVIVKTVEVQARVEAKGDVIRVDIPPDIGLDKLAVALMKPDAGEPAPTLYVRYISLEGPMDSRPASHRKLLATTTNTPAEKTREVVERFASKAYRRPVTKDELDRLLKLADARLAAGDSWDAAMQFTFTAVLVSPKFLFRVETPVADATGSYAIDEHQLASRLSYFLWASMPDDELFALAAKKRLTANLEPQVKRMLASPKAASLVDHFVMQWLQLQPLRNARPDPTKFPNFNDPLRAAMVQETRLFFHEIIRENRSILNVLDADFTYLNGPLARHYGITDTAGNFHGQDPKRKKPGGQPFKEDVFSRVDLKDTPRGGVLTHASVLTVTSNPGRTSPVKRGKWVLEQMLGTPPPPPPPNVPELEKDGQPVNAGSLRQQLENHRKNPACANCHAKMDGLGFALENFNAVGAFRTKDGEFAIDATGELPGGVKFTGPAELKKALLAKKDLFAKCLTEKMMIYALGRGLDWYDRRTVDAITAALAKNDHRFATLVTELVTSDPFRLRRGKSP